MEQQKQKSWFARNWPWVIPVTGCLGLIVLLIVGAGAAIFGVSKMITNSEPYEYAIEQASTNKEVISLLGDSIESDGIMKGDISLSNDDGHVDITIPIKGKKGKGKVSIKGEKTDGVWDYESIYVTIKSSGEEINLLDKNLEGI
ncbi:cytochrome c oxidase assembly factor Coa1 family protein [Ichthyenterobacterium sp. W332]|uniref:Cytochrome c oxidase assembly factor Coa1 family protein n=1 Tax=Microcosmobacter mediterraneus TaxID=3075607 RepID=A0ABU2YI81_9FLAO|nr:cytochrome c oxidase assembly factor Coa1 family protein [Ichthyenterobacterium sp. W332]MDT0557885.1 cytochrome c oxidase assembly factor Coa1 family protein [Ichthyenterobacterium sp. W332]